jgi:undecaprenyl-diphosphatase
MLPVIIGGGVLLIIFEACGGSSIWICSALDFLYSIITWITEITSSLQFAKIDNIYFSGWLFIPYIIAFIVTFVSTYFALKVFLKIVRKQKLTTFSIYCLIMGVVTIILGLTLYK